MKQSKICTTNRSNRYTSTLNTFLFATLQLPYIYIQLNRHVTEIFGEPTETLPVREETCRGHLSTMVIKAAICREKRILIHGCYRDIVNTRVVPRGRFWTIPKARELHRVGAQSSHESPDPRSLKARAARDSDKVFVTGRIAPVREGESHSRFFAVRRTALRGALGVGR